MASKNKTRILLQHNGQLRRFAFILPSLDGSFYFGASFPPGGEVRMGSIELPPDEQQGVSRVSFSKAEPIECLDAKFSYHPAGEHPSAVIQLKNKLGNPLFRYPVAAMGEMESHRKLVTIVPNVPQKMPLFEKQVGPYDTVIPIDEFDEKPFRAAVFVCKKGIDLKGLLVRGSLKIAMAVSESDRFWCVVEFYHKAEFQTWPRLTTFLPYVDGVDFN